MTWSECNENFLELAFSEALTLSRLSRDRFPVATALRGMARCLQHFDRFAVAALLLSAADNISERLDIPGVPTDAAWRNRAAARLRTQLGEAKFEGLWREGQNLGFDEVIIADLEAFADVS